MNTFSKFDQLGAVLSELSFEAVSLTVIRRANGTLFYSAGLHPAWGECSTATAEAPSEALSKALEANAVKQAAKVEAASTECPNYCDDGKIWNNADPTSGQYVECECAK